MRYWTTEIQEQDRLWLTAASSTVVVVLLEEHHPTSSSKETRYWHMGQTCGDGYRGVKDAIVWLLGEEHGYLELSIEDYERLASIEDKRGYKSSWIWSVEFVLPTLLPLIRSRWVSNRDLPEHENELFSFLGFNEFHASKHKYLQDNGVLPPLVEGAPLVTQQDT